MVGDAGHPDIEVAIWYPTDSPTLVRQVGFLDQSIAPAGELPVGKFSLVLISHGNGGLNTSHADTAFALASRGFVAAAVTHTGDNARDVSAVGSAEWLIDRPRHIRTMLDFVTNTWRAGGHIDEARIAVFGFSMGGYTALTLIGGTPDVARAISYCSAHRGDYSCSQGFDRAVATWEHRPAPTAWPREPRIGAAIIVAPALGFLQVPERLSKIRIPIQMWVAPEDEIVSARAVLKLIRDRLGAKPQVRMVPGARHVDFLAPCDPGVAGRLASIVPDIEAPQLCGAYAGFDRAGFHAEFNETIGDFLMRMLAPRRLATRSGEKSLE